MRPAFAGYAPRTSRLRTGEAMARNIVVFCDGTGNEVEGNLSNVLKLFRIAKKSPRQHVYYNPGIGTIGHRDAWARIKQSTRAAFGLATGYGIDRDILGAYEFICTHYETGDAIFLFGFSRGAYTVRAVAGLIHLLGLLAPDQLNLATYALTAYKRASEKDDLSIAWNFRRIVGARRVTIEFVGVWDTVASVIVPRGDRLLPSLQTLPYTRSNPSVRVFRHAMAIDERRRMFRLNHWRAPQPFVANPFRAQRAEVAQDIKQVWFAGVHSDIGGGYPEEESGLSKFPLLWMIDEAALYGLQINAVTQRRIALGDGNKRGRIQYVAPDASAMMHESLEGAWHAMEWIPKSARWREWLRPEILGWYLPRGEPRSMQPRDAGGNAATSTAPPRVHHSVIQRMDAMPEYRPVNLPETYTVE
jgi:uncharacterized protein (DUF2235 family)